MLKNSCDEETQTSSCCLTLNESLALKLENFQLKSKISELEKKCIQSKALSIDDVKTDDILHGANLWEVYVLVCAEFFYTSA